jgi:hypothetical protein
MKNAFARFGRICVSVVVGTGLAAVGLMAGSVNRVTVTLPHPVTVGSTTLPQGTYSISSLDMSDGSEYFIVRGDHTPSVTLQAQKIDADDQSDKTQVILTQDGSEWRFDKLFVEGVGTGYQFVNLK